METETASLTKTYREARQRGLEVEDTTRTTLTAILTSPHFLFRVEPARAGQASQAVHDQALAVRLSYLLWAAPPDDLLRQAADQAKLTSDTGLREQARRMLRDKRSEALVDEFFGQWLRFKNYHLGLQIDTTRYPAFTDAIRDLLHAQLQRQLLDLIQEDRPVTDLIDGNTYYISPYLARYYGIPWTRSAGSKTRTASSRRCSRTMRSCTIQNRRTLVSRLWRGPTCRGRIVGASGAWGRCWPCRPSRYAPIRFTGPI